MREESATAAVVGRLLAAARFEVVPTAEAEDRAAHLPAGTTVTVTCSPKKGIERTIDLAERLAERGFRAVPHISARLVNGPRHLRALLDRLEDGGVENVFVIGGDASETAGPYDSAGKLLQAMAEMERVPPQIGVAAYPERHPFIDDDELLRALLDKQRFASYMVTQICFDPGSVVRWLAQARQRGVRLPAYIGIPGAVKRRKLLEISLRVGVGDSVRYLTKHGNLVTRLLRRGAFRPDSFVARLGPLVAELDEGLLGLHLNTFNQVESTEAWRREAIELYGHRWHPPWEEQGDERTAS